MRPESTAVEARPLRVLVVDDHPDSAQSLAMLLRLYGYTTDVAFNGQAALDAVARMSPDAVLCDIGMPVLDGYQVAARVRKADPQRPLLVAVTAYSSDEARQKGRDAGFDHYLVKPVDTSAMLALLRQLAGSLGLPSN